MVGFGAISKNRVMIKEKRLDKPTYPTSNIEGG